VPTSSPGFFQFFDISLFNNNFAPDVPRRRPAARGPAGCHLPGILANTNHFYRENTFTVFGWDRALRGISFRSPVSPQRGAICDTQGP
jgi:hypothetical protein